MAKAHLLLQLRLVDGSPVPSVVGARISSSDPGNITTCGKELYAELLCMEAETFDLAHKHCMDVVKSHPNYKFLRFFLDPETSIAFSCYDMSRSAMRDIIDGQKVFFEGDK